MTEDMLWEQERVLARLGTSEEAARVRAKMQSSSLISDIQAFKACVVLSLPPVPSPCQRHECMMTSSDNVIMYSCQRVTHYNRFSPCSSLSQAANPECLLEDFVRWYSPRDWIEEVREADTSEPMHEQSLALQEQECSEIGERTSRDTDSITTTDHQTKSNKEDVTSAEGDRTLDDSAQEEVGGASGLGMEGDDGVKSAGGEAMEGEGWGEEWEEGWDFIAGEEGEGETLNHSTEDKDDQVTQEPQKQVHLRSVSVMVSELLMMCPVVPGNRVLSSSGLTQRQADLHDIRSGLTQRQADLHDIRPGLTQRQTDLHDIRPGLTQRQTDLHDIRPGLTQRQADLLDIRPDLPVPSQFVQGRLSLRMQQPNNAWVEAWQGAVPLPAYKQKRLFDDTREAEKVLHYLAGFKVCDLALSVMPMVLHAALESLNTRQSKGVCVYFCLFACVIDRGPWVTYLLDCFS